LIADENHPLAIAGVMGGEATKITNQTTEIVVESACFSADSVRKTSRSLAIHTDSAYRYTHHIDVAQTENLLKVTVQMLSKLYGAEPTSNIIQASQNIDYFSTKIKLDPSFIRDTFGFFVEDDVIDNLLTRLQYKVHREKEDTWIVESPSYRWDVTRPIDLVEECLRIYGVDKIPDTCTEMKVSDKKSVNSTQKRKQITQFLANNGFVECYNYSLRPETVNALPISNPLLDNQTHMRTSLIPGLIDVFRYNVQNGNKYAKFFETGHVVWQRNGNKFEELISVAFLIPTESLDEHWDIFDQPTFFDAKNLVHRIWTILTDEKFGPIEAFQDALFEENFSAKIGHLEEQSIVAHVGYLNSQSAKEFQMPLIIGEIFSKVPLFESRNKSKNYRPFSCYPAAKRDISLIVDRDRPAQAIIDKVQKITETIAKDIFTDIEINIFDVYYGENLPEQKKSLGLNLSFKSDSKTPSEKEIDHVFEQLVATIKQYTDFELRG
jgi:phenylalanyl-tRNA synthetase beta chain